MTHPEVATLLAHVDRELPEQDATDVAAHVASCTTCAEAVAGLRETSDAFGATLRVFDEAEPQRWHARQSTTDTPVIDLDSYRRSRGVSRTVWLRRAAVLLLVCGAGAAAAMMSDQWRTQPAETEADPVVTSATLTELPVAAVAVVPIDGQVTIAISGAARGSRLYVTRSEREDAEVAVEGRDAPHFTATPGSVTVDLNGAAAIVRVTLPLRLREARIMDDGRVLASVAGSDIVPTAAAESGIEFGADTVQPNE